jgi:hypothetical protein
MRMVAHMAFSLFLSQMAGCSCHDMLFSIFGDAYSNGSNSSERSANYDRRVEESASPPLSASGTSNPMRSLPNDSWAPF